MSIDLDIDGVSRLGTKFEKLREPHDLEGELFDAAGDIRREARDNLSRLGLRPVTVNWISRSITVQPGDTPLSYEVRTSLPFAHTVEFGSQTRASQPWFRPAVLRVLPFLKERIRRVLNRAGDVF